MQSDNSQYPYEAPFSFTNWITDWAKKIIAIAKAKQKILLLMAVVGAILGLSYSYLKPVRYVSEITFIVEEGKGMSGGGALSSLGGSLGIDIASITGAGNTVLSGDNVLALLKSSNFMATCLKTPYGADSNYCLADKYADVYKLRSSWEGNSKIGRLVYFAKPDKDLRLQDSLLKVIIKRIEEKELGVDKPDKKLGFFKVNINTKDELLSKLVTERILKIATEFYVKAKTSRLQKNVDRLQKRTDSISFILNKRTYNATEDARMLLNVNPADINAPTFSEISQRDKLVLRTIYGELMKNLEVSKASLIQETPTVQIVDSPVFPLEREEVKWYVGLLAGIILSTISSLIYYIYKNNNI